VLWRASGAPLWELFWLLGRILGTFSRRVLASIGSTPLRAILAAGEASGHFSPEDPGEHREHPLELFWLLGRPLSTFSRRVLASIGSTPLGAILVAGEVSGHFFPEGPGEHREYPCGSYFGYWGGLWALFPGRSWRASGAPLWELFWLLGRPPGTFSQRVLASIGSTPLGAILAAGEASGYFFP